MSKLVKARTELYKQDLARVNDEYRKDIKNLEVKPSHINDKESEG